MQASSYRYPTHPPSIIIIIPSFMAESRVDLNEFRDTSRLLTRESVRPLKEEEREKKRVEGEREREKMKRDKVKSNKHDDV